MENYSLKKSRASEKIKEFSIYSENGTTSPSLKPILTLQKNNKKYYYVMKWSLIVTVSDNDFVTCYNN